MLILPLQVIVYLALTAMTAQLVLRSAAQLVPTRLLKISHVTFVLQDITALAFQPTQLHALAVNTL
jgi:hypothetical protein